MGTYDQEEHKKVNVISSDAHILQHKNLSRHGTDQRKFYSRQTGHHPYSKKHGGIHPNKKKFIEPVSELNKQAFKHAL